MMSLVQLTSRLPSRAPVQPPASTPFVVSLPNPQANAADPPRPSPTTSSSRMKPPGHATRMKPPDHATASAALSAPLRGVAYAAFILVVLTIILHPSRRLHLGGVDDHLHPSRRLHLGGVEDHLHPDVLRRQDRLRVELHRGDRERRVLDRHHHSIRRHGGRAQATRLLVLLGVK